MQLLNFYIRLLALVIILQFCSFIYQPLQAWSKFIFHVIHLVALF